MSPVVRLFRRNCNDFGNDCNQGIRPSTYAIVIAIAIVVILFSSGFIMRRRRLQNRFVQQRTVFPETHSHPLSFQPPPPPVFSEPAPPYDVYKAPSPSPAAGQPDALLLPTPYHLPPPTPNSVPLRYPPPSYTPA